jgi:DNA-binding MarR family transcriptional regulator
MGKQVHKERGEVQGMHPHIHFQETNADLRIDRRTYGHFAGTYPHHEFFKYLHTKCEQDRTPFRFGWYNSASAGYPLIKQPTMAASEDIPAEEMLRHWSKILDYVKDFQREHGFTKFIFYNVYSKRGRVSEEEVMSFFTEPKDTKYAGEIAQVLGVDGNSVSEVIQKLVKKRKLHQRETGDFRMFLEEKELRILKEKRLARWYSSDTY